MKFMENMPQILGNADPMHYAQMLPGVQTNNEYQGGIHVQGCDNEHNQITIGGVPVYNAVHLLGFGKCPCLAHRERDLEEQSRLPYRIL